MEEIGDNPAIDDPLWQFSLEFYARPAVPEALIALQDRAGLDVNLILFALWLGISGRDRIDPDRLAEADRAIRKIRTEIVHPLRQLRRRLKDNPDAAVQRLRAGVKDLELAAEKIAQHRLAGIVPPPSMAVDKSARLAAAQANLALYLGPEMSGTAEAAVIRDALASFNEDNRAALS